MQIDPNIIPDAAVEKLAELVLESRYQWAELSQKSKHKRKRAAAAMLREVIPLLGSNIGDESAMVKVTFQEDC